MHAYTLTGPNHLVYKHRIAEYKQSSTPKSPIDLPLVRISTLVVAFLREITYKQAQVLKTLQKSKGAKSRNWLAKACHRGRDTIQHDIDALVSMGKLVVYPMTYKGREVYRYSLPTVAADDIRRSPYYWWKRCPSCHADRRLKRLATGNYLHWCRCGHEMIVNKETVR